MDGPSFPCSYLGYGAISKPPTNISVVQNPIRELYLQYRSTPISGHTSQLRLTPRGVLVALFQNGVCTTEMFMEFSSVVFVEAAKFVLTKSSSEKKPKALFVPLDNSRGSISDKHAFPLDKSFHFLVSSSHPPLLVLVVRRPTGVKALDCHVFALDTAEHSLHLAALISSPGVVARPDVAPVKGSFDRGIRGDVIRTDLGDYSVYRGPQTLDPSQQPQRHPGVHEPHVHPGPHHGGPAMGPPRNDHTSYPHPISGQGPFMLTQDNFRQQDSSQQYSYGAVPRPRGYEGQYPDPPARGHQPPETHPRQPDLISHVHARPTALPEQRVPQFRNFAGPETNSEAVRMRADDIHNRAANEGKNPSVQVQMQVNRTSAGQQFVVNRPLSQPHQISPGFQGIPQRQSEPLPSALSPSGGMTSAQSPAAFSPTGGRDFDFRHGLDPVYSASNLESRNLQPEREEYTSGGRPVAKVPPHMKGVKVLPSDFRMVKLKPKTDTRAEVSDDTYYDNNKDMVLKYKEMQEGEKNNSAVIKAPDNKSSNQDVNDFIEFSNYSKVRSNERSREFHSNWSDTVKDIKGTSGANDLSSESQALHGARDFSRGQEANNNKNQHGAPSQQPYGSNSSGNPNSGVKDLEIANMFSNFNVVGQNNRNVFRRPEERNEIEEGLGYLP